MQDRLPLYPGRVKLTPVAGQENTYDMERADQPTQEGTPLNKNSLLKDATAALFQLGPDAVPDDVFRAIPELFKSCPKYVIGNYTGTGIGAQSIQFDFDVKLVFIVNVQLSSNSSGMRQYRHRSVGVFPCFGEAASLPSVYIVDGISYGYIQWLDGVMSCKESYEITEPYGKMYSSSNKNKLSWQSDDGAEAAFNASGETYYYLAFGV